MKSIPKDVLLSEIRATLEKHGCLNTHEVCRIINGHAKRNTVFCTERDDSGKRIHQFGKPAYGKCGSDYHGTPCTYHYRQVRGKLHGMFGLFSIRMRFWDSNSRGFGTDQFRFWFFHVKDFNARVVSQSLLCLEDEEIKK